MTRPATNDLLVQALLVFGNGQDLVISHQSGVATGEVRRWSRWREKPSQEERAALVRLLHGIVNNPKDPLGLTPSGWARNAIIDLHDRLPIAKDFALLVDGNLYAWMAHMDASMESSTVVVSRGRGYSPREYRSFENLAAALAFATLLVADPEHSYAEALRSCKSPKCKAPFYLAQRNRSGGPANRIYCSPTCRKQYHNSAARKG